MSWQSSSLTEQAACAPLPIQWTHKRWPLSGLLPVFIISQLSDNGELK